MNALKEKKYLGIGIILVLIVLVGGGLLVMSKNSSSNKQAVPASIDQEQVVQTMQPSDIGLSLSPITSGKFAGHGVLMKIANVSGITSIDYTLSYTSSGNIPRGALGHIDVKGPINQELAFGTCSDVCHFDQGVSDVKLTLKVVKTDGKAYQVEQSYTPPTQ